MGVRCSEVSLYSNNILLSVRNTHIRIHSFGYSRRSRSVQLSRLLRRVCAYAMVLTIRRLHRHVCHVTPAVITKIRQRAVIAAVVTTATIPTLTLHSRRRNRSYTYTYNLPTPYARPITGHVTIAALG